MDPAGMSLPYDWPWDQFFLRIGAGFALIGALALSFWSASDDVSWAWNTSKKDEIEKAGYSRPKHKIKAQKTAQRHIENYYSYGAAWEDAARARQARMIFSGIVLPAILFLIFLGSYSWFLPDRCVTVAKPCVLPAGDALLIVALNVSTALISDVARLLTSTSIDPWSVIPTYKHLENDYIFGIAASLARYYTVAVIVAAGVVELSIISFWKINNQEIEKLKQVGTSAGAAAASTLGSSGDGLVVRPGMVPKAAEYPPQSEPPTALVDVIE
jgi:hypothetical protein